MEMSMIEVFEAYKNGTLNFMPMDLVKPESCRVFVESRNVWKEAIFISYTNRGIFAVVDGQNYSDTYKMWCTLETNDDTGSTDPSGTEQDNNATSGSTSEVDSSLGNEEDNQSSSQSEGQTTPDDGQSGSPSSDPDGNGEGS